VRITVHGVIESDNNIFVYVYGCLQKVFRDLTDLEYMEALIEAYNIFRNTTQEMK
jgi:hypothetical protein